MGFVKLFTAKHPGYHFVLFISSSIKIAGWRSARTVAPGIRNKFPGSGGGLGEHGTSQLILDGKNLTDDFYSLQSGLAGKVLLKFSNRKGPGTAWLVRRLRVLHRQNFISSGMSKMKVGKLLALPAGVERCSGPFGHGRGAQWEITIRVYAKQSG
jgi:hypothetical protein